MRHGQISTREEMLACMSDPVRPEAEVLADKTRGCAVFVCTAAC